MKNLIYTFVGLSHVKYIISEAICSEVGIQVLVKSKTDDEQTKNANQ